MIAHRFDDEAVLFVGLKVVPRCVRKLGVRADLQPQVLDDRVERVGASGAVNCEVKGSVQTDILFAVACFRSFAHLLYAVLQAIKFGPTYVRRRPHGGKRFNLQPDSTQIQKPLARQRRNAD